MKIKIKRYLITEALMIVFSVLLALSLNEWIGNIKSKRETRQMLSLVRNEMQQNMDLLNGWKEHHRMIQEKIGCALRNDSIQQRLINGEGFQWGELTGGPICQGTLSSTAWKIAQQHNLLDHVPIQTMLEVSKLYEIQAIGVDGTLNGIFEQLKSPQLLNPELLPSQLALLNDQFIQLYNQEIYLINLLEETIQTVDKGL